GPNGVPTAFWVYGIPPGGAGLLGCGSLTIIQGLYTDAKLSLAEIRLYALGFTCPQAVCASSIRRRSSPGRSHGRSPLPMRNFPLVPTRRSVCRRERDPGPLLPLFH